MFSHSSYLVTNIVLQTYHSFALSLVSPHPETISFQVLFITIPVTIGNIIGGSVFVGMVYHYLTKKTPEVQQEETEIAVAQQEEIIPLQAHMKH